MPSRSFRIAILLLILTATTGAAQEVPYFLIERVSIEGARYASPQILVAESGIIAGKSYSEAQLRDAVARVQRLPFVLRADLRLQKGSIKGTFVLVITIEETRPLDFEYRSLQTVNRGGDAVFPNATVRDSDDFETMGARAFVGARTELSASAVWGEGHYDGGPPEYSASLTQYDLFGTRASLAATVTYRELTFDLEHLPLFSGRRVMSFGDHLDWSAVAAIPFGSNEALQASWTRETDISLDNPRDHDRVIRVNLDGVRLGWLYDTTDSLRFPTRGTSAEASLQLNRLDHLVSDGTSRSAAITDRYLRDEVDLRLDRYYPLTPLQSLSGGATFSRVLHDQALFDFNQFDARAGYSLILLPASPATHSSDLRFQFSYEKTLTVFNTINAIQTTRTEQGRGVVLAGLALRNPWGVIRLDWRFIGWR